MFYLIYFRKHCIPNLAKGASPLSCHPVSLLKWPRFKISHSITVHWTLGTHASCWGPQRKNGRQFPSPKKPWGTGTLGDLIKRWQCSFVFFYYIDCAFSDYNSYICSLKTILKVPIMNEIKTIPNHTT